MAAPSSPTRSVTLRFDADLLAQLKETAAADRRSLNNLTALLLEEALAARNLNPPSS